MANSVTLTFGYENTDFTRKYKIDNVETSALAGVKTAVKAVNASIAGGTDGGLTSFFRSDDFDADATIGAFNGIVAAQYETTTVTNIPLE